jgi:hypothetical protein
LSLIHARGLPWEWNNSEYWVAILVFFNRVIQWQQQFKIGLSVWNGSDEEKLIKSKWRRSCCSWSCQFWTWKEENSVNISNQEFMYYNNKSCVRKGREELKKTVSKTANLREKEILWYHIWKKIAIVGLCAVLRHLIALWAFGNMEVEF